MQLLVAYFTVTYHKCVHRTLHSTRCIPYSNFNRWHFFPWLRLSSSFQISTDYKCIVNVALIFIYSIPWVHIQLTRFLDTETTRTYTHWNSKIYAIYSAISRFSYGGVHKFRVLIFSCYVHRVESFRFTRGVSLSSAALFLSLSTLKCNKNAIT